MTSPCDTPARLQAAEAWTRRSIELADSDDYLDLCGSVYPMRLNPDRPVAAEVAARFRAAHARGDIDEVVAIAVNRRLMKTYPGRDQTYVPLVRKHPNKLRTSAKVRAWFIEDLLGTHVEVLLARASAPIDPSRQKGGDLERYLQQFGCEAKGDAFLRPSQTLLRFGGGEAARAEFAARHLGYSNLGHGKKKDKGLDGLKQVHGFVIAPEGKWVGSQGGNQNHQLDDALGLRHRFSSSRVLAVSIMDGTCLYEDQLIAQLIESEALVVCAPLMPEFLAAVAAAAEGLDAERDAFPYEKLAALA